MELVVDESTVTRTTLGGKRTGINEDRQIKNKDIMIDKKS